MFPYLPNGIVMWAKLHKPTYINKRFKFWSYKEGRGAGPRLTDFAPYRSHTIPIFASSTIIPVNMLYFHHFNTAMHGVFNR